MLIKTTLTEASAEPALKFPCLMKGRMEAIFLITGQTRKGTYIGTQIAGNGAGTTGNFWSSSLEPLAPGASVTLTQE